MVDLFEFNSYKEFVRKWVSQQTKNGYGQFKKMADHLGVGTVLISQVFNGDRDLNEEQALDLAQFFALTESETKYFVGLVRLSRAGSKKLKLHVRAELDGLLRQTNELKGRIRSEKELDENQKAIFYSDWFYSAIRLATDVPEWRGVKALGERLELSPEKIKEAVEFLLESGLVELREGELRMGPKIVFLPATSPHVLSRQRSWRIKGFQAMEASRPEDLYFTCPIVCSRKSAEILRKRMLKFIDEVLAEVRDSPSEELLCLNIDWFRV